MSRTGAQIFDDLLNLNADEWNNLLSKELNISINHLKELIISRELKLNKNKVKVEINQSKIREASAKNDDYDELLNKVAKLNKYVIKLSDNEEIITSLSCTGKIIVGMDFSNSRLEDSYFCHCNFYNCKFTNSNMGDSIINSCTFNNCDLRKSDFTSSAIARSKFIECNLKNVTFDYNILTDSAFVVCDFSNSSFIQSKILYTGFSDCLGIKTDWKDVDFTQISFTKIDLSNSNFKRSKLYDSILVKVNLLGCDFDSFVATAITASMCLYDEKHESFFKTDNSIFNPSTFEWEDEKE